ncbi:MAG: response regulator [Candidatus Omnitrophica bacterium]|nr:response regulator [Candidatus Omnitrophota bacterium]
MIHKRILIVDDEIDICESLRTHFIEKGFTVDIAHNGKEALEKFHEHRPDAVILDIFMPVMDGITFLRELRQEEEEKGSRFVPIIVMTGCYMDSLVRDLPITAVAIKPVFFEELLKKVIRSIEDTPA